MSVTSNPISKPPASPPVLEDSEPDVSATVSDDVLLSAAPLDEVPSDSDEELVDGSTVPVVEPLPLVEVPSADPPAASSPQPTSITSMHPVPKANRIGR